MMGRIGEQVRDKLGLAYYAYTTLDAGLGPGPWAAIAGVAPENVERAIEECERLAAIAEALSSQPLAETEAALVAKSLARG